MGLKQNAAFFNAYNALDKVCCHKFGVVTGGVTEYIERLMNTRFAPGRDEVLSRLVKYRNERNRIAHEAGALEKLDIIAKADIHWICGFTKDLEKKRDPISVYLRKAKRYAKRKRARRIIIPVLIILAVIAAVAAYFLLK